MVAGLSGQALRADDGHLLRPPPGARGARAQRLAPGAACAPADAAARGPRHRAAGPAQRAGSRGAAAAGEGLGRLSAYCPLTAARARIRPIRLSVNGAATPA